MNKQTAKIWEEEYVIPTYSVYPPEKSPLFIERRAYQGSTGKVYPLPVTEKISDKKENVSYHAVFLENEYLKIMVLPELGGRIQRAYDKTNGYDFVYYNHVIKPALVGLTGPWISGGIEFNWPQHHRPSTYSPVDYTISENQDGSVTVYLSEIDKMYGTKGMAEITLYPGKAYIEIKGQLYNPTELPQTFLWWANPAVPVNDNTYSVFPPDVNAVMDHGKRAVSTFPIATGEYYKADYSAGVDISRYKNIKVPTSYMAAHSDFDFIGNYDEGVQAGLLHVADHHVSPGKKQWTWGNGDFGRCWDNNLTDEDGPYIELMTGVFTDNQPDFTWLKPYEEKTFVQYFMPYKGVGRVGNATKDAVVSLTKTENGEWQLKVYATACYENTLIQVKKGETILFETKEDLSPEHCFETALPFVSKENSEENGTEAEIKIEDCEIVVTNKDKKLVSYQVYQKELQPIPKPAEAIKAPKDLKSTEELYLAALHLEQYRHATFEPAEYYLEGLRRDASDIRLNLGYGQLLYKRGRIKESIPYLEQAVAKQTMRNPNPYSGDGYFNLGIALEADGQEEKAYDAFYKSTWSSETQSAGFYWLSCLACRKKEWEQALEFVEKSLIRNWHNMTARTLKLAILRKLNREHTAFLRECLEIDPLCMGCLYEEAVITDSLQSWCKKMGQDTHNYLELALDYRRAGFYDEEEQILSACKNPNPMCWYYLGELSIKKGQFESAKAYWKKAEEANSDYCFPNRIEEIQILNTVLACENATETFPMAHYYLGCLLYDKKQYEEASKHWELCSLQKPEFAMAFRNLAIYYYNKQNLPKKAMESMRSACEKDPLYPRFWLEYDQLAAKSSVSAEERLSVMESHPEITIARDDLYLRYITLLNETGQFEKALTALKGHRFHPWEGGEGKVSAQYKYALIQLAKQKLDENKAEEALDLLVATLSYPKNLGEGKLPNTPDNEAYYYMGLAYRMMGDVENSRLYFEKASEGSDEPQNVLYYNDQPSDYIYYMGLAHRELGNEAEARRAFHRLITFGETHRFDTVSYDFFAVSLPEIEVFQEDMSKRHIAYCDWIRTLGYQGMKQSK